MSHQSYICLTIKHQNSVSAQPAAGSTAPSDGLLIHLDNGNIVAEPVGLGDRELREQFPSDGRRMVIGEVQTPPSDMPDIVEEGGITPSALTPSVTKINTKINGGQLAPPDEQVGGAHGHGGEVVEGVSFADALRHGEDAAEGSEESSDEGEGNGGNLSRKNSSDRLLG